MLDKREKIGVLWREFVAGDELSFAQIYSLLYDDLLSYGCRFGQGNRALVEDAIQDLFVKLYQKSLLLHDPRNLRAFLYRSLKNSLLNHLLRNSKLQDVEQQEFNLTYTINEANLVGQGIFSEEVHTLMRQLTFRQKEIIYLRFAREMTFEDIAQVLEINEQSARNLLARSVEKMRKEVSSATALLLLGTLLG